MKKKYEITLGKIELWNCILEDLFKWNANKDLVLFSFKGEHHSMHFRLMHGLTTLNENKKVPFEVIPYFSSMEFKKQYCDITQPHNIIMATHFVEILNNDYLIVKKDNLSNYNLPFNKDIIVLELHSDILSNHMLVTKIDNYNLDFALTKDFTKFEPKQTQKIVKLF